MATLEAAFDGVNDPSLAAVDHYSDYDYDLEDEDDEEDAQHAAARRRLAMLTAAAATVAAAAAAAAVRMASARCDGGSRRSGC